MYVLTLHINAHHKAYIHNALLCMHITHVYTITIMYIQNNKLVGPLLAYFFQVFNFLADKEASFSLTREAAMNHHGYMKYLLFTKD